MVSRGRAGPTRNSSTVITNAAKNAAGTRLLYAVSTSHNCADDHENLKCLGPEQRGYGAAGGSWM